MESPAIASHFGISHGRSGAGDGTRVFMVPPRESIATQSPATVPTQKIEPARTTLVDKPTGEEYFHRTMPSGMLKA
jgi:hypothetical protein